MRTVRSVCLVWVTYLACSDLVSSYLTSMGILPQCLNAANTDQRYGLLAPSFLMCTELSASLDNVIGPDDLTTKEGIKSIGDTQGRRLGPFKFYRTSIKRDDLDSTEVIAVANNAVVTDEAIENEVTEKGKVMPLVDAQGRKLEYSLVYRTLQRYKELNDNLLVLRRFVVPNKHPHWPQEMWKMKLGDAVNNIRRGESYQDKREELTQLGFVYDVIEYQFAWILATLLRFKREFSDMLVPYNFIVPDTEDWPEEARGMNLGALVTKIRKGDRFAEQRGVLQNSGFYYASRKTGNYELLAYSLKKYKGIYGNFSVPYDFVVPENSTLWKKAAWGFNLGHIVADVKSGTLPDVDGVIAKTGFYNSILNDDGGEKYKEIVRALHRYSKLKGDMMVPTRFVVPKIRRWETDLWGMKLGKAVSRLRAGDHAQKRHELLAMGFCFDPALARYEMSKSALLAYRESYGHLLVPQGFVIPSGDSEEWPVETWGIKLGVLVDSIRSGVSYLNKRDELIEIGFDYGAQLSSTPFNIILQALLKFNEIEGHMNVPRSFSVPKINPDWPEETRGVKLGSIVRSIRGSGTYADKREELLIIGFKFRIESAAEKREFENVKLAIEIFRTMLGQRSKPIPLKFIIPSNGPYPEELWGMELGVIAKKIRQGLWADRKDELNVGVQRVNRVNKFKILGDDAPVTVIKKKRKYVKSIKEITEVTDVTVD